MFKQASFSDIANGTRTHKHLILRNIYRLFVDVMQGISEVESEASSDGGFFSQPTTPRPPSGESPQRSRGDARRSVQQSPKSASSHC